MAMRSASMGSRPTIVSNVTADEKGKYIHLFPDLMVFFVAVIAGAMNSLAGGGSLLRFPALLASGIPPVAANATNNVGQWSGNLGSLLGFKEEALKLVKPSAKAIVVSLIGSILLLKNSDTTFMKIVPWLALLATLLFTFSQKIRKRLDGSLDTLEISNVALLAFFLVSIYGGYFGAGMRIALLAILTLLGFHTMIMANVVKALLTFSINGIACIPFILGGKISWEYAVLLAFGMSLGAFCGARLSRVMPQALVQNVIIAVGAVVTGSLFIHSLHP